MGKRAPSRYRKQLRIQRMLDTELAFRRDAVSRLAMTGKVRGSYKDIPSTGTSKPGAKLFQGSVPYTIEREPRLGSRPKSKGYARFANS